MRYLILIADDFKNRKYKNILINCQGYGQYSDYILMRRSSHPLITTEICYFLSLKLCLNFHNNLSCTNVSDGRAILFSFHLHPIIDLILKVIFVFHSRYIQKHLILFSYTIIFTLNSLISFFNIFCTSK